MTDRPNILVLMCDQMQAQRLGVVDKTAHTPNLDRLAGEGVHFNHAFTEQAQCFPSRACFEHYGAYWGFHPFYGIRTRDAKYVRYFGPDDTEEMYDLNADPHELNNVAESESYSRQRRELTALADEWWEQTGGRDLDYYESDHFKDNRHNET